jgi:acetolactate synthase I/II/III large subunit
VDAVRAATPDTLAKAFERALERGEPALIEVPVESGSERSPWEFLTPPSRVRPTRP